VAGAPTGTALNTADPTLWPRWLMMFGLALTTVAVYVVVDTAFFAGQESDEYRRWAAGFAPKLITPGLVWFAVTGAWYIFGTLPADVRAMLLSRPLVILTVLTALGPGLPWLLIVAQRQGITRRLAFLTGLAQFGVLALNAISRQVVQNAELSRFLDVTAEPVNMQWSPLIVFLVLFVAGLGVVAWMVSKVIAVAGKARAQAG
jgi:cytochrome bd-type quinol oxidase subunit 2